MLLTDIERPVINNCLADQLVRIGRSSTTGEAIWEIPTVTDNYDTHVLLVEKEGRSSPLQLEEGIHTIEYTAVDAAGNEAMPCVFDIFMQRT